MCLIHVCLVVPLSRRCGRALSVSPSSSEALLILNGRTLLSPAQSLHFLDISLLRDMEADKLISLAQALQFSLSNHDLSAVHSAGVLFDSWRSTLSSLFLSLASSLSQSQNRVQVDSIVKAQLGSWPTPHTLFLPSNADSAIALSVHAVLDPLSLAGRRGVALCRLLHSMGVSLSLTLTPSLEVTEFPLQSFYRFAADVDCEKDKEVEADADPVTERDRERALFQSLPRTHMLTLRMDVPEPWTVQRLRAKQDTDNLRCVGTVCGDSPHSDREMTRVTYSLRELLVAGQCLQTTESILTASASVSQALTLSSLPPPNGLQLVLSSYGKALPMADTVVMQNLGYYQLRVSPGLFSLSLAHGRATALYRVYRDGETVGEQQDESRIVAVKDFHDHVRRLIVVKRLERERENLLDAEGEVSTTDLENFGRSEGKGIWQNLKSSLFGEKSKKKTTKNNAVVGSDDRVHVFSLATGQLYERLLRIMMLSVVQSCSRPVTFWLFENYLSPSFKEIAIAMSLAYNFEVRFVTYKWPQWLNQQTVQQRVIWGYKILFLDVLFPLDLQRVIYVDADQVVRSDLAELWDMDLEGKPYAYTPFCTSRKETLGFQFWQTGYWKDHLQGRPYHISALYVVDLTTFRKNAVGDSLRAIYAQLSRDPNSLANLDQDLPNYAQHQVPIHSLPQQWLWCESWCSDESKAQVNMNLASFLTTLLSRSNFMIIVLHLRQKRLTSATIHFIKNQSWIWQSGMFFFVFSRFCGAQP
jgi:UDP-glucose:glycoprotein glucosyltransferase